MTAVKLKYVNTFQDRYGELRSYLRYPNRKPIPLKGKPGSPEFMAAYSMALGFVPTQPALDPVMKTASGDQTWNALCAEYLKVGQGNVKATASKDKTRRLLNIFCKAYGHRSVSGTKVASIEAWFAEYQDRPGQHNNLLKKIRTVAKLGLRRDWLTKDPTLGVDLLEIGSHHTWNEAEIAQYEKRWKVGTRERTAFALFVFTGQRGGDVAGMRWPDYRERIDSEGIRRATMTVQQEKVRDAQTGRTLTIEIDAELIEILDAWKATCAREKHPVDLQQHIVLNAYWQPFRTKTLSEWMARNFDAAKLPDRCVSHGLRKAAARRLAELGCTPHEIMSVTGHKTLSEVQRYCDAAQQARLSQGAAVKMRERFRLVG